MSLKSQFPLGRFWLMIALVIIGLGIWSIKTIRLQTEIYPLFPQDLPSVKGLRTFQSQFASAQELLLIIPTPDTAQFFKEWSNLKRELEADPSVKSVRLWDRDPEFIHELAAWKISNLSHERFIEFQKLFDQKVLASRLNESKRLLAGSLDEEMAFRLQTDPFRLLEWLDDSNALSTMGVPLDAPSLLVAKIQPREKLVKFEECQIFVGNIRSLIASHLKSDQTFFLTGRPAFVAAESMRMKHDMQLMLTIAISLVALTFWLFYRSVLPLIWILLLQAMGMLSGVIAARFLFGELNVLSMGFAAILLGVGMDYCILVYHYFASREQKLTVWRVLRRGIHLSAITTAASFCILAFSSFPGFRQLAVLIGIGLMVIALFATEVLPLLLKRSDSQMPEWISRVSIRAARMIEGRRRTIMIVFFLSLVVASAAFLFHGGYSFYHSDLTRFRNRGSEPAKGLELLIKAFPNHSGASVILLGSSHDELKSQIPRLRQDLDEDKLRLVESILVKGDQEKNRSIWGYGKDLILKEALMKGGFESPWGSSSMQVVKLMDKWKEGSSFPAIDELMKDFIYQENQQMMLRLPLKKQEDDVRQQMARVAEMNPQVLPVSWQYMGAELNGVAKRDFRRLSVWMFVAIVGLCFWAHRSFRPVLMNLGALGVAFLVFLILLFVTGETITVFSLLSIPLLIGLIIDYSLHVLLALEAEEGDLTSVFQHLAVPIFLTGLTSVIGFGAPLASQQESLRNFGMVMDLGIISAVFTALVWIPAFYPRRKSKIVGEVADLAPTSSTSATINRDGPSKTLYRASWFGIASWIAKNTSRTFVMGLGRICGWMYYASHPGARENVRENLSLLKTEITDADVKRTFLNYGETLADYFCLGNRPKNEVLSYVGEVIGSKTLQTARSEGKGVLLITTHLSLFEYGGVWIREWNMPFTVVSLAEPTAALTDWRTNYRKNWGAETLIVGEDEFSFLSITKRLNEGGVVALLIDRPQTEKAVAADFPHGQADFSSGPALISLLSGSPIVPAIVVRLSNQKYKLELFEPIRPKWLNEGKEQTLEFFTKELAKVFIPSIQKYSDQWFHFVSIRRK